MHHGFDALKESNGIPPERVVDICGIDADTIRSTARRLASVKPRWSVILWDYRAHLRRAQCVHRGQSADAAGKHGMECGGVNPLRARTTFRVLVIWGPCRTYFPGIRRYETGCREKFEKAWGVKGLSGQVGLTMPQMMEGLVTRRSGLFTSSERILPTRNLISAS